MTALNETTLKGRTFRWTKPDARAQLKVLKRLSPIMQPLVLAAVASGQKEVSVSLLMSALEPTMGAISGLPDVDVDFIIDTCLAGVSIDIGGDRGWAAIMAPGGALMFEAEVTPAAMLTLCYRVLEKPLGDFFDEMFQSSSAPGDKGTE